MSHSRHDAILRPTFLRGLLLGSFFGLLSACASSEHPSPNEAGMGGASLGGSRSGEAGARNVGEDATDEDSSDGDSETGNGDDDDRGTDEEDESGARPDPLPPECDPKMQETCGAHASCVNRVGTLSCVCDRGYERNAQGECVDTNECESSPCAEQATCTNTAGEFSCQCPPDMFGDGFFCTSVDPCEGDPCGTEGSCIPHPNGYSCACDEGYFGTQSCLPCGEELSITDPGLRVAVNLQLGRNFDDDAPILLNDLTELTRLDARDFSIRSIAGLQCWTNLRSLDLSENPFLETAGAAALAQLSRLAELDLSCTGVSNLGFLENHPQLAHFTQDARACGSSLAEVSSLGTLFRLQFLELSGNELTDLTFLAPLKRLRELRLVSNQLTGITGIEKIPLLQDLTLAENRLTSVDEVAQLPGLRTLNVAHNQLDDLSPTVMLDHLEALNASGNRLPDLPDWSQSLKLSDLILSSNELTSLQAIADLTSPRIVNLAGNDIESLTPLVDGAYRGTLVVSGNPVDCKEQGQTLRDLRAAGMVILGSCVE